jgi:hypothetical protein
MSSYINSAQLVNTSIIGVRRRTRGNQTKYYRHPLVRNDWWTDDQFRGAQGYYFAEGSYKGSPRLFDFTSHPWWAKNVKRPLKLAGDGRFTDSSFTVYFDNENWNLANRHKRKVLTDYLAKPSTAIISGDPNFYHYLAGNLGDSSYYKSYYTKRWGHQANFKPLVKLDKGYADHLAIYRYPSRNKAAFSKSKYNLSVNSYYNYYLETFPPYEDVTSEAGQGAELLLPNLYMLESDIQNTGSVNYTDQLTLNNASSFYDGPELDVWFLEQNQVSPEGNKMYYQQFAEALDGLNANGEVGATINTFEEKFKNVAILYPDLGMLKKYNIRDDRGTPNDTSDDVKSTAFYPFYNEVVIGFDREDLLDVGGKTAQRSFFTSLFASKLNADHVRSFIVLLQLYIIENMRQGNVESSTYKAYETYAINAKGNSKKRIFSMTGQSETVCNLDSFVIALKNNELDYLLDVYNESREEMADGANYTILREWENPELFKLNIEDAIKVVDSRLFEDAIDDRKRSLKEVFTNQECPSETVMYLVEKRVDPRGPGNTGPLLQTIIMSKDVVFSDMLKYVDTQVKYGVRYGYTIKQVRMIFGNTYSYDGISFDFGETKVGQGRAVGNALGLYSPPDSEGLTVNGRSPEEEYTYLAPDEVQDPGASHLGHFVFKLPPETSNQLLADNVLPVTPGAARRSSLGRYYTAVQNRTADLSGLVVELHSGFGVDGAQDGGMTGFDLTIPDEVLAATDAELTPSYGADSNEISDPVVAYKEAIDILTDSDGGSQMELSSAVNEINTFFTGLVEGGSRQKVNGFLAQLRTVRDSFIGSASHQRSLGANDPRSAAARQIYDSVDTKVRELLATSTSSVVESEDTGVPNKLLEEVLGTPDASFPHDTGNTFTGGKGTEGLNIRFGKS